MGTDSHSVAADKGAKQTALSTPHVTEQTLPGQDIGSILRGHSILHLQHLIGNQGVQRLIASQPGSIPSIQRAGPAQPPVKTDEGLMGQGTADGFAQKIHDFINKPENENATVQILLSALETEVKAEFASIDPNIPRVAYSFDEAGGNNAWFLRKHWKVEINADNVFGGDTVKIKDLSEYDLINAIGTAYHEGRHAEQYFRIAQLYVEDLTRAGIPSQDIKKAMQKHLKLRDDVLDAAIAHPLDGNFDPAIREKIRLWTTSLYGRDTKYRNIVYTMYKEALSGLRSNIQALLEFVPENYADLPQDQQTAIAQQLPACRTPIEMHVYRLREYQKDHLQPEIDRIQTLPIASPQDINMLMLDHLMILTENIKAIVTLMPLTSEPATARERSTKVGSHIETMREELRLADYQLPEQSDAESAEAKVEEAFEKLLQKK